MASYLDEIIKDKHSVVAEEERRESLEDIKSKILDLPQDEDLFNLSSKEIMKASYL